MKFVILKHTAGSVHYDVMFERGGVLKTFTVQRTPDGTGVFEAEERFDHPLRFLEYEGPLNSAPGRVERWDNGEYSARRWGEALIELDCRGEKWDCTVTLEKVADKKWLLKKLNRKRP